MDAALAAAPEPSEAIQKPPSAALAKPSGSILTDLSALIIAANSALVTLAKCAFTPEVANTLLVSMILVSPIISAGLLLTSKVKIRF